MNKIKAVIFDVDGVLVDTVPYHFEAWRKMFEEQGVKFTFDDYIEKVNGLPRNTGIRNILSDSNSYDLDELADKKQRYFLEAFNNNPPSPLKGVLSLLKQLERVGVIAVAASSSKNAPYVLERLQIKDRLKAVVSGHDFKNPKPAPDIFLTAAQRVEIHPKHCLVIEDALAGVQAAKNGGMVAVGLLTSGDIEISKHAHLTLKSLEDHVKLMKLIIR